jgi:hypothetical protein
VTQEAIPVREKWKFNGRQLVDGVPHLMWAFDESQMGVRGRHRAEAPDWEWGCPAEAFKEVTVGSARAATSERTGPGQQRREPKATSGTRQ